MHTVKVQAHITVLVNCALAFALQWKLLNPSVHTKGQKKVRPKAYSKLCHFATLLNNAAAKGENPEQPTVPYAPAPAPTKFNYAHAKGRAADMLT